MRIPIFALVLATLCQCQIACAQYFNNPILAGFYPDPSICKAGEDYYIVNSSFAYFPGLPIFHSKDLLNWEQIGHALDRPSQLDLEGAGVSRGLFAPAITHHKGKFYIVCTLIDKMGNFVITATDPRGPWSAPVPLPEVNGIDPSLFFDENDSAYIVFNSIPPGDSSLYPGHRTIRIYEFDANRLKVTGAERLLVNGGTDISKKPVWIEGPHIIRKDGYYYLICAEGGTAYEHSEVVFRSKSVFGPYESYSGNPILTQRHLDPARPHPLTTTGHADFVQGSDGKWWAVFLGCRPYQGNHFNTGRETFMAPVTWNNGWPGILAGSEEVAYRYPISAPRDHRANTYSGNVYFRDDFSATHLNQRYVFLRTPKVKWYDLQSLGNKKRMLRMKLLPETCSGNSNPAFIGLRQPHLRGELSTALTFRSNGVHEKAGLLIFQNETHYYFLAVSGTRNKPMIQLWKNDAQLIAEKEIALRSDRVELRASVNDSVYSFFFRTPGSAWIRLGEADARFLSTETAGGFVGTLYAMYATSEGRPSSATASFHYFECKSNDPIYETSKQHP